MDSRAYDRMAYIEASMWWYRGRRMVCQGLLRRTLGAARDLRILDVGCGTGYNMDWLRDFGHVEGVDQAPEALEYCRRRGYAQVRAADAGRLPFGDRAFELVTAFDVIEHVEDDVGALREMFRVLVPGGRALIYTPALPILYGEHDRIVHHKRRYTRDHLCRSIEAAGLELAHVSYVNLLVLPAVLTARLLLDRLPRRRRPHAEMSLPWAPVNRLLTWTCALEVPWVLGPGLPIGMTLVALAQRPLEEVRATPPEPRVLERVSA